MPIIIILKVLVASLLKFEKVPRFVLLYLNHRIWGFFFPVKYFIMGVVFFERVFFWFCFSIVLVCQLQENVSDQRNLIINGLIKCSFVCIASS